MAQPRALFICGSSNQTTQMHQIARSLPEVQAAFTPYYVDGVMEGFRRLGLIDMSIAGNPWRKTCFAYFERHGLAVDDRGLAGGYDLAFSPQDAFVPKNVRPPRAGKLVLVQEGMTDPEDWRFRLVKRFPSIFPRWVTSTGATGLSDLYDTFCVASDGYKELFVGKGCDASKIEVTGIPNFDDCARYRRNEFPHRGYVLVCSSDARETGLGDTRRAFLERAIGIAAGRPLVFKLHPNEDWSRAIAEITRLAPGALVYTDGSAEEMVANCSVLVVQYSTLAYVGLALGKDIHSYYDLAELRRLAPLQNGRAAQNIADVARRMLGLAPLNAGDG